MLNKTKILMEFIGGRSYKVKEQPPGYTITKEFVEAYHRWANISEDWYTIWNEEFNNSYPGYVNSEFIEDDEEYRNFIFPKVINVWNVVNKGGVILEDISSNFEDWYWRNS